MDDAEADVLAYMDFPMQHRPSGSTRKLSAATMLSASYTTRWGTTLIIIFLSR